jgi:hypothetical protein
MAITTTNYANTIGGRLNSTTFTQALRPHAAYLSATTLNPVEPSVKAVNDVVRIPLPTLSGSWQDHVSTSLTVGDVSNGPINVTLDKVFSRVVTASSQELQRLPDSPGLLDRVFEIAFLQLAETISNNIGALFTVGNFDTAGNSDRSADTGADYVTRAQLVNLWGVLAARKIPVSDTGNLFAITHPSIYSQWSNDNDFVQAAMIGDAYASQMRVSGNLVPINNMLPLYDTGCPTTTSTTHTSYTTAVFHRNATWAQFAYPEPPMDKGTDYSYAEIMGIPILIVLKYDTNVGASGGAFNQIVMSTLCNYGIGRKDHAALDRTPFAAT